MTTPLEHLRVDRGSYDPDHRTLIKLSRTSPFTRGFADIRFIQEYYAKGWVGVARLDRPVGFVCLRHCRVARQPWTTIYEHCVEPNWRGLGIGAKLLRWAMAETPHDEIRCGCESTNSDGLAFWLKQGFRAFDTTVTKSGKTLIQLRLTKVKARLAV